MKQCFTRQKIIRLVVAVLFLALFAGAIAAANSGWNGYTITDTSGTEYETALVLEVLEDRSAVDPDTDNLRLGSMDLRLELRSGRYRGDVVDVTNYLSAMYNVDVAAGDRVTVRIDTTGQHEYQVSVYNYDRTPVLLASVAVFAAALMVIGGFQGLRAFLGLVFTFVSIVWLLLPLTLRGVPPVPLTLALVAVTSTVCFYLLGGWQPKMIAAALGCLCGVCCAAVFGQVCGALLHITAYQSDEAEALLLITAEHPLQIRGLLLSGILIASEGAVMDIAMSIASALHEVKEKKPDISRKELFRSGMQVGRDATGTMANTLVLAFTGSSLNMMVLIYSYDVSFRQLMNTDFVAIELLRGVAGSMGILMTVPCVAAVGAALMAGKPSAGRKNEGL